MAPKKPDGVIEAVRYNPDGKVSLVRVYERLGSTYADRILLTREQFVQRLKKGKHYLAGERKELMAATFETGAEVRLVVSGDTEVLQTGSGGGDHDDLDPIPLF
jgi:hypothetical protein